MIKLPAAQTKQATQAAQRPRKRVKKGPFVVLGVFVLIIAVVLATEHHATEQAEAAAYIKSKGPAVAVVESQVKTVDAAAIAAQHSETQANVNKLAELADEAKTNIANEEHEFLNGSEPASNGELSGAETSVWSGAAEFVKAMGALTTYAGNPNPSTLAEFTTKYKAGVVEWNEGVEKIWHLAHAANPPTVG